MFIGTDSPEINLQRVAERTKTGTGHAVEPSEIRRRWQASQDNLARTFRAMSTLEIIDNSGADATTILMVRNGRIVREYTPVPLWVCALARRLHLQPERVPGTN